ncbi:hypothetical protein M8J77_017276 [Diaphorina citri]|nr:hypothetical protein M8J77_017276 [Diaphorina citri]
MDGSLNATLCMIGIFRDLIRVRYIYLNHNLLLKLEAGLFTNLIYLQTVEVSHCQLSHISPNTFINVTTLATLKLEGNRLSHIELSTVEHLDRLKSLELSNNTWRCDCNLRSLIVWTRNRNLYTRPTACSEPQRLRGKYWDEESDPEQFACNPHIVYPPPGAVIEMSSELTQLQCHVEGDPPPRIDWYYNRVPVSNNSRNNYAQGTHYVTKDAKWANLTFRNLGANDAKGEFKCVATNPAGEEERNISLLYGSPGGRGVIGPYSSENWGLLLVLMCAIVILLSLSILLCCCFCRKRTSAMDRSLAKKSQNNGMSPQNGEVMHHITANPGEQGKSLLTVVNPVQKPPRRYDQGSPTFNGSATEMTELNRKLLDESNLRDDDSRAGDSYEDMTTTSSGRRSNNSKYPPDLLSFPPNLRATQPSPAGSERPSGLPPHSPPFLYGTLPYSRSQSPFRSPNGGPSTPQRTAGYVTIPRRPRASWSAAPSPGFELGSLTLEPVYDNCGVRTTADGSLLSLNKIDTAKRQLPPIPNSRHSFTLPHKMSTLPHNYRTLSPNSEQHNCRTLASPSPTTEPTTVIRPLPVMTSPEGYRSLQRVESPGLRPGSEDKFRRPSSPNRFSTQNRNNDRRRSSWTSRVGTPDNSVTGSSDTLHLISPTGRNKFTPISIQPQNGSLQPHQRASPTSISSQNPRQSPLPFSQAPQARRSPLQLNGTSKPPLSPHRKLTPVPSQAPPSGLFSGPKPAQSIEILFEDEGEDGTEV